MPTAVQSSLGTANRMSSLEPQHLSIGDQQPSVMKLSFDVEIKLQQRWQRRAQPTARSPRKRFQNLGSSSDGDDADSPYYERVPRRLNFLEDAAHIREHHRRKSTSPRKGNRASTRQSPRSRKSRSYRNKCEGTGSTSSQGKIPLPTARPLSQVFTKSEPTSEVHIKKEAASDEDLLPSLRAHEKRGNGKLPHHGRTRIGKAASSSSSNNDVTEWRNAATEAKSSTRYEDHLDTRHPDALELKDKASAGSSTANVLGADTTGNQDNASSNPVTTPDLFEGIISKNVNLKDTEEQHTEFPHGSAVEGVERLEMLAGHAGPAFRAFRKATEASLMLPKRTASKAPTRDDSLISPPTESPTKRVQRTFSGKQRCFDGLDMFGYRPADTHAKQGEQLSAFHATDNDRCLAAHFPLGDFIDSSSACYAVSKDISDAVAAARAGRLDLPFSFLPTATKGGLIASEVI